MKLQNGDIVMVKVNNFSTWYRWLFANLIRFVDGVYYHHAQIYFDGKLFEANDRVVAQPLDYNYGDETLIFRLKTPLSETESSRVKLLLSSSLNRKYDYWGAMLHQLIYIVLFRRVWLGRRGNIADRKPYCTELVTSIMHQVRGYFPEHYKTGPSKLLQQAPLYYEVVQEGFSR